MRGGRAPVRVLPAAEFERRRILRALRERSRYRYVSPAVQAVERGWVVTSPCCSRNVDPSGGVIAICWFEPRAGGGWRLYAHDHAQSSWRMHAEAAELNALIAHVCEDPDRIFWP